MVEDSAPDNVISLHGGRIPVHQPDHNEDIWPPKEVIKAFMEEIDDVDSLLIIGTRHGQLCWSSSSRSLLEILWLAKAVERVAMDHSLGIISLDGMNDE